MPRVSPVTHTQAPEQANSRPAGKPVHQSVLEQSMLPLLAAGNRAVSRYLETASVARRSHLDDPARGNTVTTAAAARPFGDSDKSGAPSSISALQQQIGNRAAVRLLVGVVQRDLTFTDYDSRLLKIFTDPARLLAWARDAEDTEELDSASDELLTEAATQLIASGQTLRVEQRDLANTLMRRLRSAIRDAEGSTSVGTIEHPHHRRYGEDRDLERLGGPSGVDQDTAGEEGNWKKVFLSAAIAHKGVVDNSKGALDVLENMARDTNIRAIVIAGARMILDRRISIRIFNRRFIHSTAKEQGDPDATGQWDPKINTLYLAGATSAAELARTWLHELTHQVLDIVLGNDSRPNPAGTQPQYDLLDEWGKVSKGFSAETSGMLRAKMKIVENEENFDSTLSTIDKSAAHLFKDYKTSDLRLRELYSHFMEIYGELYIQLDREHALVRRVMDLQLPACSDYFEKAVMPHIKQFADLRLAARLRVEQ